MLTITLDTSDAAELADLLGCLRDWIDLEQDRPACSRSYSLSSPTGSHTSTKTAGSTSTHSRRCPTSPRRCKP
jgi:hypothetical protein